MRNKDKKPNAWKRYGAIAMAGVVLLGASAVSGKNYPASVQAEETETRITLNMADDDSSDTKNTASEETETETETEKRITLNVADDEKPGSEEETEAKTEPAADRKDWRFGRIEGRPGSDCDRKCTWLWTERDERYYQCAEP